MSAVRLSLVSCLLWWGVIGTARATPEPQVADDPSLAFQVGPIQISRYALEKNRRRFEQATIEQAGRPPSPDELAAWEKLYRHQQVLIADAHASGYFARPAIEHLVAAAERYMLTQPNGPYYASLENVSDLSDERLRRIDALSRTTVRGMGVYFDRALDVRAALGPDFDLRSDEEKRVRVLGVRDHPRAIFWEGEMTWPCEPFPDAADAILALGSGQLLRREQADGGVLYFFAQESSTQPAVEFAAIRESLAAFVRQCDRQRQQREHRTKALGSARFTWDAGPAAHVVQAVAAHLLPEGRIDAEALSVHANEVLGGYAHNDGTEVTITVGAWVDWFNAQFLRAPPASTRAVGDLVGSMVLQEFDLRAARAAGIDRTVRFTEDRKNFARNQVLDAYERERIIPQIHVTDEEVKADYLARRAQFRRVERAKVRRLVFSDLTAANDYLVHHRARSASGEGVRSATLPLREETLIVSRSSESTDANFERMLIGSGVGSIFGPHALGDGVALWIRGEDAEVGSAPLAEIGGGIRQRLLRRAIEAEEMRLGEKLAKVYRIEEAKDAGGSGFGQSVEPVSR